MQRRYGTANMLESMRKWLLKRVVLSAAVLAGVSPAWGGDWPTRLHDVRRSGVTAEVLPLPLDRKWICRTARAPGPAWTESPAVHDYLHDYYDLKPRQHFDRCFDVAVVGGRVYFGSSKSGAITCLDNAAGGREVWTFFTDGPVRFAPHVVGDRVYAGSDDGTVYCLDAADGSVVWSERAGPSDEMFWGNENMISVWPVRGSVLVDRGEVFWTAGVFPEEGMFLCNRRAADGSAGWTVHPERPVQGYLLATAGVVIAPTGKTYPYVYSRKDGSAVGTIKRNTRDGGCWALLTPETSEVWTGPSIGNDTQGFDARSKAHIATVRGANYLIADATHAYYNTDAQIIKIRRRDRQPVWTKDHAYPHALIKAGDTLFAGGDGEVAAFDEKGDRVWQAAVDGKAYGLAAADGCLFVSTDKGSIYSFTATIPLVTNGKGARRVTASSADLNGLLVSHGGSASTVHVCWGTCDGGTDRTKWAHTKDLGTCDVGPIVHGTDGLKGEAVYYYRFLATNSYGTSWAESSCVFMTGGVSIRASDASASEGGRDGGAFEVFRPGWATGAAMQVHYTVGGTAVAGGDYEPLSGRVIIPQGEASVVIPVRPIPDLLINEPVKTVTATVVPGGYVPAGQSEATIRISDDESAKGWAHTMEITFPGYTRSERLIDFPVLVILNDSVRGFSYRQFASSAGGDLRFTDGAETRFLPYEIERWDASGDSYVWVRVPELSPGKTRIRALWGNPDKATRGDYTGSGATWSQGYEGVWHFHKVDGALQDSSSNRNAGKPANGVAPTAGGVIDGAASFDGEDDQITLAAPLEIGSTSNTVAMWVRVPAVGSGGLSSGERVGIVVGNHNDRPNSNWELHNRGQMRIYWNGGEINQFGTTDLRDDRWHHVAWVRDKASNAFHMYIDGRPERTVQGTGRDITFVSTHKVGSDNRGPGTPNFHGRMDELRISAVGRSADWIWACWKNQGAPDQFSQYRFLK